MEGRDVKLYALSTCHHCKNTKKFLSGCGVEYECIDVDKLRGEERRKVVEEVKSYNPLFSFPTIVIGDKVIVGFREDELKEVLNLSNSCIITRTSWIARSLARWHLFLRTIGFSKSS